MPFAIILICALAVVGLWALIWRVAVWLMPKERVTLALAADGLSLDEVLCLCHRARLLCERSPHFADEIVALTDQENFEYTPALREEGILVYGRKK